ncbi:MAG: nitroreductase [Candidatus Parvarchaeum acidophilus ARMAN-5]|jgi:nitroreductase|uniref:Nitroreductase n=1 Tax=Candidatus Parvarchaeum acidophilus ARMAN-5 TaxID=662762 RepID=D6GVB2_PARA5|nr:MAG: nitroreductase [Candidatus Parvarchaeum acidophilus ARMAN-5]
MDVQSAIENRGTTYHFSDKEVSEEIVVNLIEAAVKAPAAGGIREYEFIIVTDKSEKEQLSKICLTPNIDSSPFMIVVVCDISKLNSIFEEEDSQVFCVENASLAIENLLLVATSYGLGSAWIATLQQEPIRKLLNIPENYIVRGIIPVGYPREGENSKKINPITNINKIVHLEKFNNNEY